MRLTLPHHTSRASARKKLERLLSDLHDRHGGLLTDLEQSWDGDRLDFRFKAKGLKASGSLEVTDEDLIFDGKLPLMALPFEGRIRSAVEKEAKALFKKKA